MRSLHGYRLPLLAFGCLGFMATAGLPQMRVEPDGPLFALTVAQPSTGQAHCDISMPETRVCAQTSLLVTLHCKNDSNAAEEWLDADGVWELIPPDGRAEKSQGSRYSTAVDLIRLEPSQE
jgi:hypothetical protein